MLRCAFSGEDPTAAYSDEIKNRRLPAHTYRLALLMSIQPEVAKFIFDDVIGGTPQRFLWFSSCDPGAPEVTPEHPGTIEWRAPHFSDPEVQERLAPVRRVRRLRLGVAEVIVDELRTARRAKLRTGEGTAMDSHAGLVRLKVAGLVTILDGRIDVGPEDWWIAGLITETSDHVRDWMQTLIAADGERRSYAANERAAERAGRVETAKAAAIGGIARVAAVMVRHFHKHEEEEGCRCTRRCLARAVDSRDRDQFDAALGHAIAAGWIVEAEDGYAKGDSRPA